MENLNKTYTRDYCEMLEMAYGPGLMAEGGAEAIDGLAAKVPLKGKVVLDFGSGLGGVAVHLASTHGAHVTGLEINPYLVEEATCRIPSTLKGKVQFVLSPDGVILPFKDHSFDVLFSKGVIVHLTPAQKAIVFKEFQRILKPGGKLVIHDWLSPKDDQWNEKIRDLIEMEGLPLYAQSPESYTAQLKEAGFQGLLFEDHSQEHARYNADIVRRLQAEPTKSTFLKRFTQQEWEENIKGYDDIATSHASGALISGHFYGERV